MSADPTKYTKKDATKLPLPLFKVVTAIGLTSFCIYWYIKQNSRMAWSRALAVCKDQHIGDGKLMPLKQLNNKMNIPMLGLGTWGLGNMNVNGFESFDKTVIDNALSHAINTAGYRLIDCASDYQNEYLIGDSLSKIIDSNQITRQELFIVSKLNQNYHQKEHVKKQLIKTLNDLKLDYLDLFLIHWPFSFEYLDFDENERGFADDYDSWTTLKMPGIPLQETWRAMEELVDEGLVKSIGVCNFNVQLLYELLSYARIKPVINQIELHPYNQQENLIKFCHFAGIDVMAYSPLGTPGNKEDNDKVLLDNDMLHEIGNKYGVSAAQVALKWNVQRDVIVVTKSNNIDRLSENKSILHFKLNQQDMAQINGINTNLRYLRPENWGTTSNIPVFD